MPSDIEFLASETKFFCKPYDTPPPCPLHREPMELRSSGLGRALQCLESGCTMHAFVSSNDGKYRLVDAGLLRLRSKAHLAFDSLWKGGYFSRTAAFKYVAEEMCVRAMHISHLNAAGCKEVLRIVRHFFLDIASA